MNKDEIIKELSEKNAKLEDENMQLKNKLKIYTSPTRNTKYYEMHKEDIIQKTKEYKNNLPVEKRKEYARRAYLKKKDRINSLKEKNEEHKNGTI